MRSALQRSVLGLGALSRTSWQQAAPSGPAAAPYRPGSSRIPYGGFATSTAAAAIALGACTASAAEPAPATSPEPQATQAQATKLSAEACWDHWLSSGPRTMLVTGMGFMCQANWIVASHELQWRFWARAVDFYEWYGAIADQWLESQGVDNPGGPRPPPTIQGFRSDLRELARSQAKLAKHAVEGLRPYVSPLYDTPAAFVYGMTKPALLAAGSAAVLTSPTAARLLPTSTRATALVLGLAPATGLGLWYLGVGAAWWGLQGAEARARSLAEEYEAAAKEREGGHGQEQV